MLLERRSEEELATLLEKRLQNAPVTVGFLTTGDFLLNNT